MPLTPTPHLPTLLKRYETLTREVARLEAERTAVHDQTAVENPVESIAYCPASITCSGAADKARDHGFPACAMKNQRDLGPHNPKPRSRLHGAPPRIEGPSRERYCDALSGAFSTAIHPSVPRAPPPTARRDPPANGTYLTSGCLRLQHRRQGV